MTMIKEQEQPKQMEKKVCQQCGCEIIEKVESLLYECERCIGEKDE